MAYRSDYFKRHKILQVIMSKAEAQRVEAYAKRHEVSVSALLRKLVLVVIESHAPNS